VACEIGQAFRPAVTVEVLRGGRQQQTARSQLARDQCGIVESADPDGNIDAFGRWVDEAVGQPEVDRQIGRLSRHAQVQPQAHRRLSPAFG